MAREALNCWHCGTSLANVPLPIGRRDECPHCSSSLHVCRLCDFYDRSANKQCREPMSDEVGDKEHANFCDYFRPHAGLTASADPEAADSRARLEALFGTAPGAGARRGGTGGKSSRDKPESAPARRDDSATDARRKLDKLFENK